MIIDSHCHLADEAFSGDRAEVVRRARDAGVDKALCILSADQPEEVALAGDVAGHWPGVTFAAGVHPHRAAAYASDPEQAAVLTRQALGDVGGVAVGEIGLDYHYDFAPRDTQLGVFAAQVNLAGSLDRPVVIHTREAMGDTLAVLLEAGPGRVRGVLHCFTGSLEEARQGLDLGLLISFSGIVTFPRAAALREVARFVPHDRLLVETDAPYLAPVPHRGTRNEPAWVAETLAVVAHERSVPVEELAAETTANFGRLIGSEGR